MNSVLRRQLSNTRIRERRIRMIFKEITQDQQTRTCQRRTSTSTKWRKRSSISSNEKKSNFVIESISQKCNVIALQQVNSVSYARTFQVSIYVKEHRLKAMIDSSATENFMTKTLIEEKNFSTRKKSVVYDIVTIDEQLLTDQDEKVNEETKSL